MIELEKLVEMINKNLPKKAVGRAVLKKSFLSDKIQIESQYNLIEIEYNFFGISLTLNYFNSSKDLLLEIVFHKESAIRTELTDMVNKLVVTDNTIDQYWVYVITPDREIEDKNFYETKSEAEKAYKRLSESGKVELSEFISEEHLDEYENQIADIEYISWGINEEQFDEKEF